MQLSPYTRDQWLSENLSVFWHLIGTAESLSLKHGVTTVFSDFMCDSAILTVVKLTIV